MKRVNAVVGIGLVMVQPFEVPQGIGHDRTSTLRRGARRLCTDCRAISRFLPQGFWQCAANGRSAGLW